MLREISVIYGFCERIFSLLDLKDAVFCSLFSAETESVMVNVLEKKVTLTFRLPTFGKVTKRQIAPINKNALPKVAIIKRIFRTSRG